MKKLATILLIFAAFPAAAQQPMTPLQEYLYGETGYVSPRLSPPAPAPQPIQPYATAYSTPYAPYVPYTPAPETGYESDEFEDPNGGVGPSSNEPTLRGLLTSAGN